MTACLPRAALVCLALITVSGTWAQEPAADYMHSVYYTAIAPTAFRGDKCVYDISTRERVLDLFAELSALGINAMTLHSAYTPDGALYPTDNPALQRSWRWPEDSQPVDDFLAGCQQYGLQAWLGIYLGSGGQPLLAQQAADDILRHFGAHPSLAGIVPPIEGRYTGISAQDFAALSARIKQFRPGLRVMDYPSSPYSPQALHWLMQMAQSGQVDIENVQFHACDDQLEDLREARGLTLLTMGVCPGIRTIIHTHYKNGVSTPQRPTQWLPPERAWEVTQSAIITATPYGTSIFSFLHACWGEQSSDPGGDSMWRRLKWYEGIVGVQRLLPMYAGAQPDASVQIMIPAGTLQGAQAILAQCYQPLARAHLPAGFFLNRSNLPPATRAIIVPAFAQCSAAQARLLQEFVADGGVLVACSGVPAMEQRYADLLAAGALTPHAREVLGLSQEPPVAPGDLQPQFAAALGFSGGPLAEVAEARVTECGRGRIIVLPGALQWAQSHLAQTVTGVVNDGWQVEGLPEGFVIERWRQGETRMLLIMGSREGLQASDVRVTLPAGEVHDSAWLIEGESAAQLPLTRAADRQQVNIPRLGDSMALVVLGQCPWPILRPQARTVRTGVGQTVTIGATLLNATGAPVVGRLRAEAPAGWTLIPAEADYELAPGQVAQFQCKLQVPAQAQRRPYFVRLRAGELLQRVIVFPEDGAPQIITERTGPLVPSPPVEPSAAPGTIGEQWLTVTAGEAGDNTISAHCPGVCFYAGEWGSPRQHQGRTARYGELLPGMAGPNFWVNDPDRRAAPPRDLLLRVTYIAPQGGRVQVHDGSKYHDIGDLQPGDDWRTDTWTVPRDIFAADGADYGRNYPGVNVLGQFYAPQVYVHSIQVRMIGPAEEDEEQ